jgi:NDP-sugar pyrophosphorylase family protein
MMRAVVLAGGKGTRLRPYTTVFPKPLVPVGDYPILEIVVRQLARQGFDRITLSTGHLAELIQAYFADGDRWGLSIDYVREERPLNTAGALGLIDRPAEDFLVMNGDVLATLDYGAVLGRHSESSAVASVAVTERESTIDFGVAEIGDDGDLVGWREKPSYRFAVSMGVYALSPQTLDLIEPGEALGMPDLLMRIRDHGGRVRCERSDAYWLDIGRVDDYAQAQEDFVGMQAEFLGEDAP